MTEQELEIRLTAIEETLDRMAWDDFMRGYPPLTRWLRIRAFIAQVYR